MGKTNNKGRGKFERHVRILHFEMGCDAWKLMSPKGRAALLELRRRFNGQNNGEITCSVREMATALNCVPVTAVKALAELQEKRWVYENVKGCFNWKTGDATTWILCNEGYKNALASKDYLRWQAPEKKQNPVLKNSTAGTKKQYRDDNIIPLKLPRWRHR